MKPVLLCILDGVGIRKEKYGNAVKQAKMPNFNMLLNNYPNSLLKACGQDVGLPEGQMGTGEVGHGNIGAGRVVYQPLEIINRKIATNQISNNQNILEVIDYVKKNNSKLHLMGLLSDGGVHSHINHLFKLIDIIKDNGITKLYIHAFLDGRDTLPDISIRYLDSLQKKLNEMKIGKIVTISGRYYAMDRDNRWDRVKKAYDAIVCGQGEIAMNYEEVIVKNYNKGIYDEFIIPTVIGEGKVEDNDGIINFNFRPDRLRELNMALTNKAFKEFNHKKSNVKLVTMMPVSDDVICKNAYQNQNLKNTLGEYLADNAIRQLRIAETEKYAHVTYFFDGGEEKKLKQCQKILIPSPKVATYDLKPEMSAYKITDTLLSKINDFDFIVLNFANGDMVGHTGNFNATIQALESVDKCLGKILKKMDEVKGTLIITADHGNSDLMLDNNGNPITSYSLSEVPFIIAKHNILLNDGALKDIAPTILEILGIDKPEEMTGKSLINYL